VPAGADPTAGMWFDAATNTGITLTFLDGDNAEAVRITGLDTVAKTINGCFWSNHVANTPIVARGSFANGIVPPSPPSALPNGFGRQSSEAVRRHQRRREDDVHRVRLRQRRHRRPDAELQPLSQRDVVDTLATAKPVINNSMILLSNVHPNPPDASGVARPCFQYQWTTLTVQGAPFTFVLDVAVTLTVWTQSLDPITKQYQTETKALLNVSPRNVFSPGSWPGWATPITSSRRQARSARCWP